MKTISADQFKQQYGEQALQGFQQPNQPKQEPGLFQRMGQDIQEGGNQIAEQYQQGVSGQQSPLRAGTGMVASAFNAIPKVASEVLPQPVRQAGESIGQSIGKGLQWLGDKLSPQFVVDFVSKHPQAAKMIEDAAGTLSNTGQIAGNILAVDQGVKGAQKGVDVAKESAATIGNTARGTVEKLPKVGSKLLNATGNNPADIMTRVARLTPKEEVAFQNTAGKSLGQYLQDTGNFGAPDEIIKREAEKFVQSRNMVDTEMGKLPGQYRVAPVEDGLKLVVKKAEATSTESVKSPFLSRANDLLQKSQDGGLTMGEVNEAKRLLERNVKLGYNKLMNGDIVQTATNVDNKIRTWQFSKAKELGFKNLDEMNKQTQISKFIIDKLGDQVIGKQGLNNIGLTDWIVLSGMNPGSAAGFLTKRFFSSKAVMAKVAKYFNTKEATGMITPDTIKPIGALPAPVAGRTYMASNPEIGNAQVGASTITPFTSFEEQAQSGTHTTINPKTGDQYIRDIKTGKLKFSPKSTKQR